MQQPAHAHAPSLLPFPGRENRTVHVGAGQRLSTSLEQPSTAPKCHRSGCRWRNHIMAIMASMFPCCISIFFCLFLLSFLASAQLTTRIKRLEQRGVALRCAEGSILKSIFFSQIAFSLGNILPMTAVGGGGFFTTLITAILFLTLHKTAA